MVCEEIIKKIPAYIINSLNEEETGEIEKHLCICHSCREYLSNLLDNPKLEVKKEQNVSLAAETNKQKFDIFDWLILFFAFFALLFLLFLFFHRN